MSRILVAVLLLAVSAGAQDRFDPDALFKQAREIGFDGKREESRQLCLRILEQYPDYNDVRVFLGRLHSWDGQYDDARRNLLEVLAKAPAATDARNALIDVELWSENPDRALEHGEAGLEFAPADETLLYKKAVALDRLDRPEDAARTLEFLLDRNPAHKDARALIDSLETGPRLYRLTVNYGHERISSFSPWHASSISLSRQTRLGSVIGRFNYANRFSTNTHQYEIDAYPSLRQGLYAYVSYGYSPGSIFPKHRAGFEVFANPGRGLELSGGFRYLHFSEDVWIYTGSVGKYFGNYFVSLRPFVTPGTTGTSASGTLLMRRYWGDSDSYVGVSVGAGSSPDDALTTLDLERLKSYKVGGSASLPLRPGVYWDFSTGWDSEQLPFDRKRNRLSVSTGITTRF